MAEVKVSLMEPRLRKVAGVSLHPGLQAISDSDFATITQHPIGASLVERGIIVERKPKAAKAEAPQDKPEPPARAAELVAEIADTFDVARLRELAEDSRKTVSDAATEKLAKIEEL